jgi:hypothetical protein
VVLEEGDHRERDVVEDLSNALFVHYCLNYSKCIIYNLMQAAATSYKPLTRELLQEKCKGEASLRQVKNVNLWGNELTDVSIVG